MAQLPEPRLTQLLIEFGLTRQQELQQFTLRILQIEQQAKLVQSSHGKRLRLVNHYHWRISLRLPHLQPPLERPQQITLAVRFDAQIEILRNELKYSRSIQTGVKNIRTRKFLLVQALQEVAHEHGFAGTGFSG